MRHYLEGSLFAVLFQLHHKFDPSIRLPGVDAAFVALGVGQGNGQVLLGIGAGHGGNAV